MHILDAQYTKKKWNDIQMHRGTTRIGVYLDAGWFEQWGQAVTLRGWRGSGISVSECASVRHEHTRDRRDRRRVLRRSPPATVPSHRTRVTLLYVHYLVSFNAAQTSFFF